MPTDLQSGKALRMPLADVERPGFHLGHRRWLDGLRGIAVLLVLSGHLHLTTGGHLGVDIFFVLSGFLITCILLREYEAVGTIRFGRFYLNRALRLLPALATLFLGGMLYTSLFRPLEAAGFRREALCAACYVTNLEWLHGVASFNLGHTWSLSVDEQFYLVWPVLILLQLRCPISRRRKLLVVACAIIAVAALRLGLYRFDPVYGEAKKRRIMALYVGSHTRADSLLVGCLTAMLAYWNCLPRTRRFVRAIGPASLASAAVFAWFVCTRHLGNPQYFDGLYTLIAGMVAVVITRYLVSPSRWGMRILEAGPLVMIGRISYGVYLYHIPVILWGGFGQENLGWSNGGNCLVVLVATFGIAGFSHRFIEQPFLRLKRHSREVVEPSGLRMAA